MEQNVRSSLAFQGTRRPQISLSIRLQQSYAMFTSGHQSGSCYCPASPARIHPADIHPTRPCYLGNCFPSHLTTPVAQWSNSFEHLT